MRDGRAPVLTYVDHYGNNRCKVLDCIVYSIKGGIDSDASKGVHVGDGTAQNHLDIAEDGVNNGSGIVVGGDVDY